jgi:glycosyltransferase involved in cell wall biosynthesis
MVELIRLLTDYDVILLGKNWENSPYFTELENFKNFEYLDVEYEKYPEIYNRMRVLVSVSILEGGPLSLLESMFCGVMPVMTMTGMAPDLIVHGDNGFLYDLEAQTVSEVVGYIKNAYQKVETADVSTSIKHLSWNNFAKSALIQMDLLSK